MQAVVPALGPPSFPGTAASSLPILARNTTTEATPGLAPGTNDKQSLPVEPSAGPAKRRGKARAAAKREALLTLRAKHRQPAGGKDAETYVTRAELDSLIAENTRLKAQLRNQLTADNRRLQEMLVRFS